MNPSTGYSTPACRLICVPHSLGGITSAVHPQSSSPHHLLVSAGPEPAATDTRGGAHWLLGQSWSKTENASGPPPGRPPTVQVKERIFEDSIRPFFSSPYSPGTLLAHLSSVPAAAARAARPAAVVAAFRTRQHLEMKGPAAPSASLP